MTSYMRYYFQYILLITSLCSLLVISCKEKPDEVVEIRGIYGHPKPLWDKGYKLNELGINAVFVHGGSVDKEMVNRAKSEGIKVFAEYATLNGKNYVETHPEAWAINEKGEKVDAATWFMGVCPTEPGFRQYRFNQLRDLLKFDLDGIFMDYVHWHAQFEDPEPILPETCFCDLCLSAFATYSDIKIPNESTSKKAQWILNNHDESWRNWRCQVIYDWTYEVKSIIKEIKPNVLLGLYHCPWNDEEFDGARRRILGLDYDLLKETIDVFSPMVYHEKMGRKPDWVKENIEWFSNRLNISNNSYPKVWPIVQAHNSPGIISKEDFETVLRGGLEGKSSGVMMFTTSSVAEDEGKIEVMKRVYTELKGKPTH
ncbi:family 10 glycosylhydrolase [Aureibaculum sp. 2210JD6-5]|uniref:family 10 glycosylhydrolase n=1 Tax=Aureibaculum sp. 2210JD6-5 TaxID=3103957 RepID=UPI002AAEE8D7|nr:family 10 glycosylhydrolase [Aureibaculum sp. 2210JD6-5]MDY7395467.1 family 10 glycosylhydrolase [Aureibaculum sp. 2210JD6-5]